MHIDLSFVENTLPLIHQLVDDNKIPVWEQIRGLSNIESILENGRIIEEDNRSLMFEEWTSLWINAASVQTNDQLGVRQQYMFDNMRTAVKHLDELSEVFSFFKQYEKTLGAEIEGPSHYHSSVRSVPSGFDYHGPWNNKFRLC